MQLMAYQQQMTTTNFKPLQISPTAGGRFGGANKKMMKGLLAIPLLLSVLVVSAQQTGEDKKDTATRSLGEISAYCPAAANEKIFNL